MNFSLSTAAKIFIAYLMITQCWPSLAASTKSRGGVIEGNGGEYITNEQNPWFLGSTSVSYCIILDPAAFSVSLDQARVAIKEAIETWGDIVRYSLPYNKLTPRFLLAKKNIWGLSTAFTEVPCSQDHELEFRLGVMDSDIAEALTYTARSVVALSYRTQYSDETGRAKGKIWVSADLGDQRYSGPNEGPGFWTKNFNLVNVLIHELGHIFGLSHMEAGLMAEDFPAKMLEYGFNSRVGSSSLVSDFILCGDLLGRDLSQDLTALVSKVFNLDFKSIDKICFFHYDLSDGYYTLEFFRGDHVVKAANGQIISATTSGPKIKGRFLAETDTGEIRYSTHSFFQIATPFFGLGIQKTAVGDLLTAFSSVQPSTLTINLGYEGKWQEFFLVKDSQEIREMLKLNDAE